MNTAGIATAAERAIAGFDPSRCACAIDELDSHGLNAMSRVLTSTATLTVAPRHAWLARRWRAELRSRGRPAPPGRDLPDVCHDLGLSAELAAFFQRCNDNLPGLLEGRILPQELLFPDGDVATAEAAYRSGAMSRYLNAATREIVSGTARQLPSPVRVLELGAGIGGTTADVLPAIAGLDVDYHFTDVSAFFLTDARRKFAGYPGVRYGILDINADLDRQPPAGIVLAANVLHNSHHIGRVLRQLHAVLTPGGLLVVIESCREHCQILTSMHFLMSAPPGRPRAGADDLRAGTGRVFLREHEWSDELASAGFELLLVLPEPDHPMSALGQRVFAARRVG